MILSAKALSLFSAGSILRRASFREGIIMEETENRRQTCCFTGHRPEKLQVPESLIVEKLDLAIQTAICNGYRTFISGMAKGVDIWAAEQVLSFRKCNPQLTLVCAIPYPGYERRWDQKWKTRFQDIIQTANAVHYISQKASYRVYQARNVWMVDHSSLVISVYNGSKGGTQNTLAYAKKQPGCAIEVLTVPFPPK